MAFKLVIVVLLVLVVVSLFQALYVMLKGDGSAPPMSKFLGRRLAFSAAVLGSRFVLYVGLDSDKDAAKAMTVLKQA